MRRLILPAFVAALLAGGIAMAQNGGRDSEAASLALAKRQALEAGRRASHFERQADAAIGEAARARAQSAELAARIEAAEADITAAETRIRIIEARRASQRARLAEKQEPVVRLTAALQTMARRPAALALIQPGSVDELVHVRSLLASTLPVIRARTEALRAEVAAGNALRAQADRAVGALVASQRQLRTQRLALAQLEARERRRSESLSETAILESDRALAFGEEARELATLMGTREYQDALGRRLVSLPGPRPRPRLPGEAAPASNPRQPSYRLPVEGRLTRGMGEISDGGVHARGLSFETQAQAEVVAPADGRIAYAGFMGMALCTRVVTPIFSRQSIRASELMTVASMPM